MVQIKKQKILIIDDQKSLVWGLEKFLNEKGFDVNSSFDGFLVLLKTRLNWNSVLFAFVNNVFGFKYFTA